MNFYLITKSNNNKQFNIKSIDHPILLVGCLVRLRTIENPLLVDNLCPVLVHENGFLHDGDLQQDESDHDAGYWPGSKKMKLNGINL